MKYKKYSYILVLILTIFIRINGVFAAGPDSNNFCYYLNPNGTTKELKVFVELKYGADATTTKDLRLGGSMVSVLAYNDTTKLTETPMLNWASHYTTGSGMGTPLKNNGTNNKTTNGTTFEIYYPGTHHSPDSLLNETNPQCPKYIVVELNKTGVNEYFAWGTNSESLAKQAVSSSTSKVEYAYASNFKNGNQITRDDFFGNLKDVGIIGRDENVEEYICETLTEDLFGTKNNPTKLRYYIELGLQYIRVIVPILIIVLGMLDFSKAVFAGKEDNMRKAQSTFIKRLIAGVLVFFVPVLVDVIMYLADIVWQGKGYTSCKF